MVFSYRWDYTVRALSDHLRLDTKFSFGGLSPLKVNFFPLILLKLERPYLFLHWNMKKDGFLKVCCNQQAPEISTWHCFTQQLNLRYFVFSNLELDLHDVSGSDMAENSV